MRKLALPLALALTFSPLQTAKAPQVVTPLHTVKTALAPLKLTLHVKATFYTAYCKTGCIGITKTGINVKHSIHTPQGLRIIAVDPTVIPLNRVVLVKTPYGAFTALTADTGSAIKGKHIDILVKTEKEAFKKGVVPALVFVR